jgi:hypothetical protein
MMQKKCLLLRLLGPCQDTRKGSVGVIVSQILDCVLLATTVADGLFRHTSS